MGERNRIMGVDKKVDELKGKGKEKERMKKKQKQSIESGMLKMR